MNDFWSTATASLSQWFEFGSHYTWILYILLILISSLVANHFIRRLFDWLVISSKNTSSLLDVKVVEATRKAVRYSILGIAIVWSLSLVKNQKGEQIFKVSEWFQFSQVFVWVFQAFLIVLITLIANYFIRRLFDKLALAATKTNTLLDDMLVDSARKPVRFFVWVAGVLWAATVVKDVSDVSNAPYFDFINLARDVSFIVLFAWFAVRFIRSGEATVQMAGVLNNPIDATTASALGKLLRLSIIITTALVVLQTLGIPVSGILAFGGIGGIAVGFAAKDLLANFFGGLMIYLDQPFKVGDWIRSPDKEIEGSVEHIGWRLTCIRTFDKRPLYVPNATFANISVENPSRMKNRRIKETFGVRYEDVAKVEKIVEEVKSMLKSHPEIDATLTLIVNLNSFAPSSVDFFIYTFTKTTDWIFFHEIKQDIMLKVIGIVESNGAEFAFPTQTLHVQHQAENLS